MRLFESDHSLESISLLNTWNISFDLIVLSQTPKSVADVERLFGAPLSHILKTLLFVSKDKQYILITLSGDKKVDTKTLEATTGLKALKPAKPEEVSAILNGITIGGVTPLLPRAILEKLTGIYLDSSVLSLSKAEKVSIGSGKAEIGIQLTVEDLARLWEIHLNGIVQASTTVSPPI